MALNDIAKPQAHALAFSRTGKTQRMIEDLLVQRDKAAAHGKPFRAFVVAASSRHAHELESRIMDEGGPGPYADGSITVIPLSMVRTIWACRAHVFVDDHAWESAGSDGMSEIAAFVARCT